MTPRRIAVSMLIIVVIAVVVFTARMSVKTWQHRPEQAPSQIAAPSGAPPAPR